MVEDTASGERLRNLSDEAVARRAAELEAARAVAEKQALEEELARLRRSLESPSDRQERLP